MTFSLLKSRKVLQQDMIKVHDPSQSPRVPLSVWSVMEDGRCGRRP